MSEESKKRESVDSVPLEGEPEAKKIAVEAAEEKKDDKADTQGSEATLTLKELSTKFPSLPLENSTVPLMGLLFAASWCDDCEMAMPIIKEFAAANTNDIQFVYIASDKTEEEMKQFVPSTFEVVPFENEEERSSLKRHFGACAAKEREPLGMSEQDRKHGIPTLIVLDTATGTIVTSNGVDDIEKSNGDSVVEKWKGTPLSKQNGGD